MKCHRIVAVVFAVAFAGLLLVPRARATEWDKTTRVTINKPIEVPGMVLPAGTYTFKLFEPGTHIVQIWNADQTHLYANVPTVPDYRRRPTAHTVLQLKQTSQDAPPELRAWFYPGDTRGNEFVYSHSHPVAENPGA